MCDLSQCPIEMLIYNKWLPKPSWSLLELYFFTTCFSYAHTQALPVISYQINFRLIVINLHINVVQRQSQATGIQIQLLLLLAPILVRCVKLIKKSYQIKSCIKSLITMLHSTYFHFFAWNTFISRLRMTHIINVWPGHMFVIRLIK